MKDPFDRTKVVLRHLPPTISQSALMEQIDCKFAGRYKWVCFRPGKNSQKNHRFSRAYIDFQSPEDVVEFAEFFDGHIFVNEKGAQFKTLVEYAPSQCVPKAWPKKDGREGTIFKDPEYLEFLELLAKPVENLPSAEIQLERREAERAGGPKESPIVTPLMDFVRQKRAAKSGSQRSSANGKLSRRAGGASPSSSSPSSKRGSEKRRGSTSMYVLRDNTKISSGKDKATYMLLPRKEDQQLSDKHPALGSASATEVLEDGTVAGSNGTIPVASGSVEIGRRRVVLLRGKEREVSHQHNVTTSIRNSPGSTPFKQSQGHEASGRIIRSILSSKDGRQNQSYLGASLSELQTQAANLERDKRPPRPPNTRPILKDNITGNSTMSSISDGDGKRSLDDKAAISDMHGSTSISEKHDRRTRNKDRPDRGVWTPLRRSDGGHAGDDTSLEGISISQQLGGVKDADDNMGDNNARAAVKGSHRHGGRRGQAQGSKEVDGSLNLPDGKPSKRGGSAGYGSNERQVWVQKSGSGS